MKQSEINQEIVNSTHRILEQIKALEVCPNTPNGMHRRPTNTNIDTQNQSSDVLNLISSLQTDQSEELLRDVHNWSDARVHTYETYEKPLLDQMEINQKTDSSFADEFSPKLKLNINNFDNKLTNAKEAVANLADSLIRQRCSDPNDSSLSSSNICEGYSSNILQFQGTAPSEPVASEDDEQGDDYERMKLREAHLVQIVTDLSNEIESMSNEAVSKNLEIIDMQHEVEQKEKELNEILANNKEKENLIISFSNRIDELEQQLESEKQKVEKNLSMLNNDETENIPEIKPQYSESSSQTTIEIENTPETSNQDTNKEEEEENIVQPLSTFRVISNFTLDIEPDEKLNQNQNESNDTENIPSNSEQVQAKQFAKFGEVHQKEIKNVNNDRHGEFLADSFSPNDEFESLLKMEGEECPGSAGRSSVLPLGIKRRRVSTGSGTRSGAENGYTYRLFFKDRDGGAVIVDAEIARRDERTGVMLLKPCDVRTARSPNKARRDPLFGQANESNEASEKSNNKEKDDANRVSEKNNISEKDDANKVSEKNNISEKDDADKVSEKYDADKVSEKIIVCDKNDADKVSENIDGKCKVSEKSVCENNRVVSECRNGLSNQKVGASVGCVNASKGLTRQQELMRRILAIHERQMAKIKAARAAAAASYYAARMNTMPPESMAAALGIEEAKIVDLNKSVERQIRFDGKSGWSNFRSVPSKIPGKQVLLGNIFVDSTVYPHKSYNSNLKGKQKIVQQKNRKVVVPNQPLKMKSPRRPFVK